MYGTPCLDRLRRPDLSRSRVSQSPDELGFQFTWEYRRYFLAATTTRKGHNATCAAGDKANCRPLGQIGVVAKTGHPVDGIPIIQPVALIWGPFCAWEGEGEGGVRGRNYNFRGSLPCIEPQGQFYGSTLPVGPVEALWVGAAVSSQLSIISANASQCQRESAAQAGPREIHKFLPVDEGAHPRTTRRRSPFPGTVAALRAWYTSCGRRHCHQWHRCSGPRGDLRAPARGQT
jgi:hypothetical protein